MKMASRRSHTKNTIKPKIHNPLQVPKGPLKTSLESLTRLPVLKSKSPRHLLPHPLPKPPLRKTSHKQKSLRRTFLPCILTKKSSRASLRPYMFNKYILNKEQDSHWRTFWVLPKSWLQKSRRQVRALPLNSIRVSVQPCLPSLKGFCSHRDIPHKTTPISGRLKLPAMEVPFCLSRGKFLTPNLKMLISANL